MITDVRPQRHRDPSHFCSQLDIIWAISYCSEMDKNNLLFCGQRVFPAVRSWVHWVRGGSRKRGGASGWLPKHRKVALWLTVEGCQGWILVFPRRPSPSTLSILNMSITADPSAPVGGIGGCSMFFQSHEFCLNKYTVWDEVKKVTCCNVSYKLPNCFF